MICPRAIQTKALTATGYAGRPDPAAPRLGEMLGAVADRALDPEAVWGKFARDSPLEGGVTSELVSGIRGSGPHFGILFPPLTRPRARAREGSDENPAAVGRSAAAANSC